MSAETIAPITRAIRLMNPLAVGRNLWSNRNLIRQFTRREIEGRYQGSYLGILWSFLTPLVMMVVYTFVFGFVFKARWPSVQGGDKLLGFAVVMFAGQIAFQLFAEPVNRASSLIIGVPNFVKKVVFPLEILPVAVVGAAAYHVSIGLIIALGASLCIFHSLPWTILLVPLSLMPLALFGMGLTWFLSSLGVYLRDVGYLVGIALQILFFATPIFYPISALPERLQVYMYLNPLTGMIGLIRGHLILGEVGSPGIWALAYATGMLVALMGYAWFTITRKGFADVL